MCHKEVFSKVDTGYIGTQCFFTLLCTSDIFDFFLFVIPPLAVTESALINNAKLQSYLFIETSGLCRDASGRLSWLL